MKKLWYVILILGIILIYLHQAQINNFNTSPSHEKYNHNFTKETSELSASQKENLRKYLEVNSKELPNLQEIVFVIP